MGTYANRQYAHKKYLENEARYRTSSHGRRSSALIAAANGNMAPAEMYQKQVEGIVALVESFEGEEEVNANAQLVQYLTDLQYKVAQLEVKVAALQSRPANSPAPNGIGPTAAGEFAAEKLVATVDAGKVYWKVQGGQFSKHGIIIWPEVLDQTEFAGADPLRVYDLAGWTAVYTENGDGHKKIVSLRQNRDQDGSPDYPLYADAAQPAVRKGAEADAAHWRRECETAGDTLMFDTAMVRLEPWFKDADTVGQFREVVFGEWSAADGKAFTAGMLAYAGKRKVLNGSVTAQESHSLAKIEGLNAFKRAI